MLVFGFVTCLTKNGSNLLAQQVLKGLMGRWPFREKDLKNKKCLEQQDIQLILTLNRKRNQQFMLHLPSELGTNRGLK